MGKRSSTDSVDGAVAADRGGCETVPLDDHQAEIDTLRGELAYLRRTLGMVRDALPYREAKGGGCAHARKLIAEATDTSERRFRL